MANALALEKAIKLKEREVARLIRCEETLRLKREQLRLTREEREAELARDRQLLDELLRKETGNQPVTQPRDRDGKYMAIYNSLEEKRKAKRIRNNIRYLKIKQNKKSQREATEQNTHLEAENTESLEEDPHGVNGSNDTEAQASPSTVLEAAQGEAESSPDDHGREENMSLRQAVAEEDPEEFPIQGVPEDEVCATCSKHFRKSKNAAEPNIAADNESWWPCRMCGYFIEEGCMTDEELRSRRILICDTCELQGPDIQPNKRKGVNSGTTRRRNTKRVKKTRKCRERK